MMLAHNEAVAEGRMLRILACVAMCIASAHASIVQWEVTGHVTRAYARSVRHTGIFPGDAYQLTLAFETRTAQSEDVPPSPNGARYDHCIVSGEFTVSARAPLRIDPALGSLAVVQDNYSGSWPAPNWTDRVSFYARAQDGAERFEIDISGLQTMFGAPPALLTSLQLPGVDLDLMSFADRSAQVWVDRSTGLDSDLLLNIESFSATPSPGTAALLILAASILTARRSR